VSVEQQGPGLWIVRAALVLLAVQAGVRYYGQSSTSDAVAGWLLLTAVVVGTVGAVVMSRQRKGTRGDADPDR
jgi:hypothetical protein